MAHRLPRMAVKRPPGGRTHCRPLSNGRTLLRQCAANRCQRFESTRRGNTQPSKQKRPISGFCVVSKKDTCKAHPVVAIVPRRNIYRNFRPLERAQFHGETFAKASTPKGIWERKQLTANACKAEAFVSARRAAAPHRVGVRCYRHRAGCHPSARSRTDHLDRKHVEQLVLSGIRATDTDLAS
jgi:hypothetical protein